MDKLWELVKLSRTKFVLSTTFTPIVCAQRYLWVFRRGLE